MKIRILIASLVVGCLCLGHAKMGQADEAAGGTTKTKLRYDQGFQVQSDQAYADCNDRSNLCDIYLPEGVAPDSGWPALLVVHGGAWMSGDKWMVASYARMLARNGFAVAAINYRLSPDHKFPAPVDDLRSALIWLSDRAEEFSIDRGRIGLFGYSAGGHLSLLVASLQDEPAEVQTAASLWDAADPRWNQLPKIRAVCAGGPPTDFRGLPADNISLAYFLGGTRAELPKVYEIASPASHVSSADPDTQIIHGEEDLVVPIETSRKMLQLQRSAGVDSDLLVLPKQGHIITFMNPKTGKTLLEFMRRSLQAGLPQPLGSVDE